MRCALKHTLGFPIGRAKYRLPAEASTRDSSWQAFLVPRGSSASPYRPSPTCSATERQDSDEIELSANGKARISPFTGSIVLTDTAIGRMSTNLTWVMAL